MLLAYSLNVDTPTILYFALAFLGVAALAIYLIAITFILRKVSFALGTVLIGVRAIAARTKPLDKVVGDIAGNVGAISGALGAALGEEEEAPTRTTRPRRAARPAPESARPSRSGRATSSAGPPARRRRTAVRIPPPPVEEEPEEEEPEEEMAPVAAATPARRRRTAVRIPPSPVEEEPEEEEPEEEMDPVAAEPEEEAGEPVTVGAPSGRFVPGREPGAWRFE